MRKNRQNHRQRRNVRPSSRRAWSQEVAAVTREIDGRQTDVAKRFPADVCA